MNDAFVDTSALAKRYLQEAGSAEFDAWFGSAVPVLISALTRVELSSAAWKCVRTGRLTVDQVAEIDEVMAGDVATGCLAVVDLSPSDLDLAKTLIASHSDLGLRTLPGLRRAGLTPAGFQYALSNSLYRSLLLGAQDFAGRNGT